MRIRHVRHPYEFQLKDSDFESLAQMNKPPYHTQYLQRLNIKTLISFGGAGDDGSVYSNHYAANDNDDNVGTYNNIIYYR